MELVFCQLRGFLSRNLEFNSSGLGTSYPLNNYGVSYERLIMVHVKLVLNSKHMVGLEILGLSIIPGFFRK